MRIRPFFAAIVLVAHTFFLHAQTDTNNPVRIVIECEDMEGVAQNQFGPGKEWQVGRWGHDLYQNMIFGGVWASRTRVAMTDDSETSAEATATIDVPLDGTYKVWAKYECPPFFNYPFAIRIESLSDGQKGAVFYKVYGLRESPKHFCFTDKPTTGDLYWVWGIDHDAAEGYEVALTRGRYHVALLKASNVPPSAARSVDAILLTTDPSPVSAPRFPRYPLLDELRRANHVFFRFRNPKTASAPIKAHWNRWGHRYNDFYKPSHRELVKFYDNNGNSVEGGRNGDWPRPIAPGEATPWYDLGPTLNTESTAPFDIRGVPEGGKPGDPSLPIAVDIATAPNEKRIVKSFELAKGEVSLALLVQPDLHTREGAQHTRKLSDVYVDVTEQLNREPRLGPIPKKLRLFAGTGAVSWPPSATDIPVQMAFRHALGLNTIPNHTNPKDLPAVFDWAKSRGGLVERSISYHHSTVITNIVHYVKSNGLEKYFYYLSYGDEIGLPPVDVKDEKRVAAFREFVKAKGESPASLGVASWDTVKPMATFSADVAVQIGVIPREKAAEAGAIAGLKKLYWYSAMFRAQQGIAEFAEKTKQFRAALGDEVHTSANLGGMHPFYWMHQSSFIESFKHHAMSLAWSEDYTYCMPQGSRLVTDFEAAYLRKGASYHHQPMMFYCMPHWPGNTPEYLLQCAVMEWGQNVKDLDFFVASPDGWSTENYIAYRGGIPTWKIIRAISGMAGLIEDHLLPARTEPAKIAMLLSEASDVWELNGKGQWDVKPGSEETNISQEERMAIWFALRKAGHRVDHLTEEDCADGLLKNYAVLYVCGQNLDRKAAAAIREWVANGGVVFATAGAARKDEFDAPLPDLDEVLGRGRQVAYNRHKGAMRARLELLFEKPLDTVKLASGELMKALCSREEFEITKGAKVLATFGDNNPAWIENAFGQGRGYYIGTLPGQAWLQPSMPFTPCGKGGVDSSPWMVEPIDHDALAASVILHPVATAKIEPDVRVNKRGVVTNRLKSDKSTLLTVVNLAQQHDGPLKNIEFRVSGLKPAKKAWSCFHAKGSLPMKREGETVVITLPTIASADVIVIE